MVFNTWADSWLEIMKESALTMFRGSVNEHGVQLNWIELFLYGIIFAGTIKISMKYKISIQKKKKSEWKSSWKKCLS